MIIKKDISNCTLLENAQRSREITRDLPFRISYSKYSSHRMIYDSQSQNKERYDDAFYIVQH